ncbi:MAG: HlyD family efflux transporter periplasmic adaptor subunit, partial [Novosphingobium sp.]|nr:HlyD family efflux transporter periplasmic adaptor subunit [Novosphingobium sp.]
GQTVAASFNTPTLFVIAEDLSQMKLQVSIDEADVGSVKEGQNATFSVDAFAGKTFPAVITRVDIGSNLSAEAASSSATTTSTSGQVVSYAADLTVANPNLELRPGMTATADIITSRKSNVLLIPNAALRFRPQSSDGANASQSGGIASTLTARPRRGNRAERTATAGRGAEQTVYVVGENGQPKAVTIVIGDSDGSHTEVVSDDLKPGMAVITGQFSGTEGQSGSNQRSGGGSGGGQRRGAGGGGGG